MPEKQGYSIAQQVAEADEQPRGNFIGTAMIIVSAGPSPFVLRYRSMNEARSPFDTSGRTGIHRAVAETMIKANSPLGHRPMPMSSDYPHPRLLRRICQQRQGLA